MMKHQAIQYLALDVHQATIVGTVRCADGQIMMRATIRPEAKAILGLVRNAGPRVHVAFEEGTQAQWLHDLLAPHAEKVIVCNTRGRERRGNKSDRIDADRLSDMLRLGSLQPVFHRATEVLTLKELVASYTCLVQDSIRVMQRIKAIFRARAIVTPGVSVYRLQQRKQWLSLLDRGAQARAAALLTELDVLFQLRPKAKAAMIAEAKRHPSWRVLKSIPYLGPVRVAQLLATIRTPFRFRTKRNLWAYAGFAVVTRSSANQEFLDGKLRRRNRPPLTRGLNPSHNPVLKDLFKGAATAATGRPGPLRDYYEKSLRKGVREEMARVTLARKIIAVALRLWKKGELWDPEKLTMQAT